VARRHDLNVEFLPMVKVRERDGSTSPQGVRLMRQLIEQRIGPGASAELFGANAENRVSELIRISAGYPRELVRLLRGCLNAASSEPLGEQEFARLINEVRESYRLVVLEDSFEWLAAVHVNRFMTTPSEEHRQRVELMLINNVILRYANADLWYDIHPAVREIPGVAACVNALRSRAPVD
jgi:hypothetical protein